MNYIFSKTKSVVVSHSETFFFYAFFLGMMSFSWFNWKDECLAFLTIFDKARYLLAFVFLSLRYLGLLFTEPLFCKKSFPILLLFVINFFLTKDIFILQSIVFIYAAKGIETKKIVKVIFVTFIVSFAIFGINFILGNISNIVASNGGRVRNYLGFKHPGYISSYIMTLMFSLWYVFGRRRNFIMVLFSLIVSIFLWIVPNTRTDVIMIVMFTVLVLILPFISDNIKITKYFIVYLPIIVVAISLLLIVFYYKLNDQLSFNSRFITGYYLFRQYGIHLLSGNGIWTDNFFVFLLINFGIIPTTIYIVIFIKVLKKSYLKKDYIMLALSIVWVIAGFMNTTCLNARFNFSLLSLYTVLPSQFSRDTLC